MPETTNDVGWTIGQGRYEVKRKLGEGGMAFALLALDKTAGGDVVLKVPKPAMMADPEFARRFRREIRSMQELTHEHIVKIKDVGEHEGMPFYVMDLLAGGSLQDRFELAADNKIKPMPPNTLADWLGPVARALDFIHQRFVHRDIKPANILFDAYGNAFVSDFGMSDPLNDTIGEFRVTRGGSWSQSVDRCRATNRNCIAPEMSYPGTGLRLVMSAMKAEAAPFNPAPPPPNDEADNAKAVPFKLGPRKK